jgi:hypothetical protein
MHADLTTSISPIELQKLYQTPVKGNLNNDDNVNPTKFSRHQSTLTPQSYAPTLNDPNLVVKTLFSDDDNELS